MDVEFLRYQFEDEYSGVITKNGFKIGIRHIQMLYMLTSSVVLGFVRGSMGLAVLAIVDPTRRDDTYIKIHNWDSRIQGAVLSSFFFGYTVMIIPSELFLRRIGGKLLMTAILIVNGALSVAMPTIVNKGGWVAACNAKLFMGMAHACLYTINQSLFDSWMPPNEKKIFSCLVYGGVQIGIIVAFPVAGLLTAAPLGWELIYYCLAMMTLSMAAISGTLMANTPESHQAVGDGEKELIKETLSCYKKKELKRPWRKILNSPPFWGVTCAHAASNALFIFYLTKVPAYLLTFNILLKDSAWYTMLCFISLTAVYFIFGPIINWVYRMQYFNYIFNSTFFMKVVNILSSVGVIIGLTVLSNLPRDWSYLAIVILTGILGMLGFQFCGFLNNYRDMSENYSGTLMLISSAVSSAVGTAVPFVSGLILGDDAADSRHWRILLLTLASVYLLCNVVYTSLASNERQQWDHMGIKKELKHYNGVLNVNQVQLDELGYSNQVQLDELGYSNQVQLDELGYSNQVQLDELGYSNPNQMKQEMKQEIDTAL